MQGEEKNNGMEGTSVEEMLLGIQESYQEAQLHAQEGNRAFVRTKFFCMDKFGTYRLRILPVVPNLNGSPTHPGHEYPVHQLSPELEKPATGSKPQKMYVTVTRVTDAGYSVNSIETYCRITVEAVKEDGDGRLAEEVVGGLFGDGLRYSYGHCPYVFDLDERAKGVRMMTLSYAQLKGLDERRFKLWSKKLAKNPSYPCPISSMCDAYPVEIEKRKNGARTEYTISIGNGSEPIPLTKEELIALMGAPRTPEVIYHYVRYHLGATVEFLKQHDGTYDIPLTGTDEMRTVIDMLDGELPKENIPAFSFDRRTKDSRRNGREGGNILLDDLSERYDEPQRQGLDEETEEGQELHAMIRGYTKQEGLSMRATRSTGNRELFDLIEGEIEGPKSNDEPENVPEEGEEQPGETEEHTGHPRHRR